MSKTTFTVDLTKVEGNGIIKCPKCGVEISPDDTTEEIYSIIRPIVGESSLNKTILQCNVCQTRINLVGFELVGRRNA